jgi:hypothetical protein
MQTKDGFVTIAIRLQERYRDMLVRKVARTMVTNPSKYFTISKLVSNILKEVLEKDEDLNKDI